LVVKEQTGRSQSRGPNEGTKASRKNFDYYYCKQPGHIENCSKYKEMLKKNGGPTFQELMEQYQWKTNESRCHSRGSS